MITSFLLKGMKINMSFVALAKKKLCLQIKLTKKGRS